MLDAECRANSGNLRGTGAATRGTLSLVCRIEIRAGAEAAPAREVIVARCVKITCSAEVGGTGANAFREDRWGGCAVSGNVCPVDDGA